MGARSAKIGHPRTGFPVSILTAASGRVHASKVVVGLTSVLDCRRLNLRNLGAECDSIWDAIESRGAGGGAVRRRGRCAGEGLLYADGTRRRFWPDGARPSA